MAQNKEKKSHGGPPKGEGLRLSKHNKIGGFKLGIENQWWRKYCDLLLK